MPDIVKSVIEIEAENPGTICNTSTIAVGEESNTFFAFTDNNNWNGLGAHLASGNTLFCNQLSDRFWLNITGGVDGTLMQLRYIIDRNGVTATGIQISATFQVWGILDQSDFEPVYLTTSFINDNDTNTSQEIADKILSNFLLGIDCFDQWGNSRNIQEFVSAVAEDGSTIITSSYSYADGYAFRLKARNVRWAISGSVNYSGQLTLTKFEQLPAFKSKGLDIITKDIDFEYPGVRKKVYKVIVTYKSPVNLGQQLGLPDASVSNVKPYYAVNGKMRLNPDKLRIDWSDMNVTNLPSTSNLDHDARWIRAELKPAAGASAWNNIYSMALRFRTPDSLSTKGFEINDISIIYRLKSPK